MRNIWKKLTASLLALVLTVQLLPVSALADEFEIDGERHDTFTYEQPDVSGEIPELRGEYEKHFSLSDGTYSAVVYPYPVHYDSNGTWQEIDNTLRSGSETYMVAAEPGVELAELLPAEQGGGLTSLTAEEDSTDDEATTPEPSAELPEETPPADGSEAEIIIVDDTDSEAASEESSEEPADVTGEPLAEQPEEPAETPEASAEDGGAEIVIVGEDDPTTALDIDVEQTADDDTLKPDSDMIEISDSVVCNTDNNFRVFLPSRFADRNRIGVSYKGYTIYFRPDSLEATDVAIPEGMAFETENERKMSTNALGEAIYPNLYSGVDVKYSLIGQTLKEYYEFSDPDYVPGEVSTTLYAPGLTPVLHDDGRIELQDDSGETIFVIPQPYMFDSRGMVEFNVAVTVRTLSTGEIRIVYTLDKEWIFDEERAWPLTLDPTITVQVTNQSVEDTAAYSGRPNEPNIYWQNFMLMGYVGTYLKTRSYIRIKSLPELKSTDVILDSSLRMYV